MLLHMVKRIHYNFLTISCGPYRNIPGVIIISFLHNFRIFRISFRIFRATLLLLAGNAHHKINEGKSIISEQINTLNLAVNIPPRNDSCTVLVIIMAMQIFLNHG